MLLKLTHVKVESGSTTCCKTIEISYKKVLKAETKSTRTNRRTTSQTTHVLAAAVAADCIRSSSYKGFHTSVKVKGES